MVRQLCYCCECRILLASTIEASAPKDACRLTSEQLGRPHIMRALKERDKLSRHHSKSRWKPKQKPIRIQQLFWLNHCYITWFWRCFHLFQYSCRKCLRYLPK
uniref:Uncharacterized protein n=1 Tax=Opuntia streptacantha TaxID=393608 RepID=A0A7C9AZU0_OPUST